MRIFVIAGEDQKRELGLPAASGGDKIVFKTQLPAAGDLTGYSSFFILNESWRSFNFGEAGARPVLINSVITTLSELKLPPNVSRINAWPGFLQRDVWEVASAAPDRAADALQQIERKAAIVKDEPGLVAARIMSMIINEAFFALGDKVSTMEEINLSMKSGTNYPGGPFEWASRWGIENVYGLLKKLSLKEQRYVPAPELTRLFTEKQAVNTLK